MCPLRRRDPPTPGIHATESLTTPHGVVCTLIALCCEIAFVCTCPPFFLEYGAATRLQVYEAYPSLLAEQTAYATAAATLNLKHYRINNYAIESEKVCACNISRTCPCRISLAIHRNLVPHGVRARPVRWLSACFKSRSASLNDVHVSIPTTC